MLLPLIRIRSRDQRMTFTSLVLISVCWALVTTAVVIGGPSNCHAARRHVADWQAATTVPVAFPASAFRLLPSKSAPVVAASAFRMGPLVSRVATPDGRSGRSTIGSVWLLRRSLIFAQKWTEYPWPNGASIDRGPGGYLAWWKLLILWSIFVLWIKTTDWVNRDCREHGLAYATWIPVVYVPFLVALLGGGLTIPVFAAGAAITFLAWLVPLIVYVVQRNSRVELHQRVMTKDHIRFLGAEYLRKAGLDVGGETKAAHEKGAQVTFKPEAENEEKAQANFISARQSPGFLPTKEIVHSASAHRADKIMMDFAEESLSVKFQVDGVWHDGDDQHDDNADEVLSVLKYLASANPDVRGKRQSGRFTATVKDRKLNCQMVAQGTKTGERVLIGMTGATTTFKTLEELGMREKMVEQFKDLMLSDNGILVLSAMPSGGLSTTLNVSLRSTDRLLRDFVSLEDVKHRLEEVENVDAETYNVAAGESPADKLPTLLRKQPDVLIVPDLHDAATVELLCSAAKEDQLIFTTIRAKEGVEALLRVLLLKVSAELFAPTVVGVLNQRLVRVLCETCKEAYTPTPALLKKLGIPPGRVEELFRHPEDPDEVCEDCHGIGYRGRTSIFELVTVDARMREALVKQPKLDVLRKASRLAGNRTLQEEGIAAVVRGITSLPELMRVLKQ